MESSEVITQEASMNDRREHKATNKKTKKT